MSNKKNAGTRLLWEKRQASDAIHSVSPHHASFHPISYSLPHIRYSSSSYALAAWNNSHTPQLHKSVYHSNSPHPLSTPFSTKV